MGDLQERGAAVATGEGGAAALFQAYWDALVQFGPFEVGPAEFVRQCQASDRAVQDEMRRG